MADPTDPAAPAAPAAPVAPAAPTAPVVPPAAPPEPAPPPGRWRLWHTLAGLAIVAAIIALAIWAATSKTLLEDLDGRLPVWTFLALAALFLGFAALVGWGITGHVGGLLMDPTKGGRMSLSRLQVLAWTFLVLSAYLNAFIVNLAGRFDDPLDVDIPGELLVAMGISIGSLAGAKVVLAVKENNNPGAVLKTGSPGWSDLFQGDTIDTANSLDLGKMQLFYITIALVLGYGIVVATGFAHVTDKIDSLPALDQSFVALLAISHAGYLTTKAAS
jgi:hypothetical protein